MHVALSLLTLAIPAPFASPPQGGAPVAVDDAYTTAVDDNLSQDAPGVLENDSDPEGDPLTAVLVSSAGATGMLFLSPDGSFEYEPAALGTDTFTYQASDGTSLSNVATITFTVTAGTTALEYADEGLFNSDLIAQGYERFQESFEDDSVWGTTRVSGAPSITSQGITWSSNYPTNNIRTGSGPAFSGNYGFFSLPHGNYLAGPQCLTPGVCTDGWRGSSAQPLVAIGGLVDGTGAGGKLRIILDDDPARAYDLGFVSSPRFVGVFDPNGFNSFEFREMEGTSEDAFYIFGDHFTFAFKNQQASGPLVYGCGPNPIGSLRILAGTPAIGTTVTLGIDNPIATQTPGSSTLMILSTNGHAAFPCGRVRPRVGMAWQGAPGEVLLSLALVHRLATISGPAWPGPGTPAAVPVAIPNDPFLIGLAFYAQGAVIDMSAPRGYRIGLTEAAQFVMTP